MTRSQLTAIATTIALNLAACSQGAVDLGDSDYPMRLAMVSEGIGDIVVDEGYLTLDDGSQLPIQALSEGVYGLPSRPTRLANGTDFCSGRPVSYFTLHETADGLVAMNAGDWMRVPELPPADIVQAPGACATFTFRPA